MSNLNPTVYLGAPAANYEATEADANDPYVSKIGGWPAWLRPVIPLPDESMPKAQQLTRCARCPKCRSAANLKLLSQIYAPLDVYDRILYLFMCVACSSPKDSVVCVFRSQLYNASYEAKPQQTTQEVGPSKPLFSIEDDDGWGDEDENNSAQTSLPAAASAPVVQTTVIKAYPSATESDNAMYHKSQGRSPFPMIVLDTFPEPEGEKEKPTKKTVSEQLAEVEAMHPGITEVSSEAMEADTFGGGGGGSNIVTEEEEGLGESPDDVASTAFFAKLALCPSQCIRWAPAGQPLLSSFTHRPPSIPPCSQCGAERVFEFQQMAPTLFYFEKYAKKSNQRRKVPEAGSKASKQQTIAAVEGSAEEPHFTTVTVFTCSRHCYDAEHTVCLEYAHVEPEL